MKAIIKYMNATCSFKSTVYCVILVSSIMFLTSCPRTESDNVKIELVADVRNKIDKSLFSYKIPDTMKMGQSYRISAFARKGITSIDSLKFDFKSTEMLLNSLMTGKDELIKDYESTTLKIDSLLSVELYDVNNAYSIKKLFKNEKEKITDQNYIYWEWEIEPQSSEINPIVLNIHSSHKYDDEIPTEMKIVEKEIYTEFNFLLSLSNFIKSNYKWLIGTFLLPFLVFGYNIMKNKKNKNKTKRKPIGF